MQFTKYFDKSKSSEQKKLSNSVEVEVAKDPKLSAEQQLDKIKEVITAPSHNKAAETELNEIKDILKEPTESSTSKITDEHPSLYCPNCYSTSIKILVKEQQLAPHHFRYLCLICRSRFNDESRAPFEFSVPPIDVWIRCWFLLGTTDSLEYVAAKLHLDLKTVKEMVKLLQDLFRMKGPAIRNMSFDEWLKQYEYIYIQRIKDEILSNKKKLELLHGEATSQPSDTAELRRQKDRNKPKNKNTLF